MTGTNPRGAPTHGSQRWRTGFGISPRLAGVAPLFGLLVGGIGVFVNTIADAGDLRVGPLPWAISFTMACFAVCSLGILSFHGPDATRPIVYGAWWTTLAFVGIGGFFLALAIGGLLGIDEDEAGVATVPPLLGIMFGVLSMAPANLLLAAGVTRAGLLPRLARTAVWVAAPIVPLLLLVGGASEGTVETLASSALIGVFGLSWTALGVSGAQTQRR